MKRRCDKLKLEPSRKEKAKSRGENHIRGDNRIVRILVLTNFFVALGATIDTCLESPKEVTKDSGRARSQQICALGAENLDIGVTNVDKVLKHQAQKVELPNNGRGEII